MRYRVLALLTATLVCSAGDEASLAGCGTCDKSIVEVAAESHDFKTLVAAVKAADLVEVLSGKGPFTVFAPTDKAFAKMPPATLKELLKPENRQKLARILTYHVVPANVMAQDVVKLKEAKTAEGSKVKITVKEGTVSIDEAKLVKTDIRCKNGVIHVIDSVLLPQPIRPRQALRVLEDAIRRGVPVFNRGDHRECAEIYTTACQTIIDLGSEQVPKNVLTALTTALGRARQEGDALSRAWALRHSIDSALVRLRNVSPSSSTMAKDTEQVLFTFDSPGAAAQWQTTNDGVMGGRSDGRFRINEDNNMKFFGTLSLENNGGFASVRSRRGNLGLERGDAILARVRGDGREYSLNLYTPIRRMAFSYRANFRTRKDEWIEVRIPLDEFVATSFGRLVRNQQLDPSQVNGLGILLGDKKAGAFELEVDWIKVVKTS